MGRQFYNTDIEVEILSKEETEKMTYVVCTLASSISEAVKRLTLTLCQFYQHGNDAITSRWSSCLHSGSKCLLDGDKCLLGWDSG